MSHVVTAASGGTLDEVLADEKQHEWMLLQEASAPWSSSYGTRKPSQAILCIVGAWGGGGSMAGMAEDLKVHQKSALLPVQAQFPAPVCAEWHLPLIVVRIHL